MARNLTAPVRADGPYSKSFGEELTDEQLRARPSTAIHSPHTDDLNSSEPGDSATYGEQAGWGWAIPMLYRVLASPSGGHPMPNKPRENANTKLKSAGSTIQKTGPPKSERRDCPTAVTPLMGHSLCRQCNLVGLRAASLHSRRDGETRRDPGKWAGVSSIGYLFYLVV
jgi:hypothetical protein